MKKAVCSTTGRRHSFYSNSFSTVTAVGAGKYGLNNPIKPDGSLTKYAQLLMLVAKYPNLTKKEILSKLGYTNTGPGFLCSLFQPLLAGGLLHKTREGKTFTYSSGCFFDSWKITYLK